MFYFANFFIYLISCESHITALNKKRLLDWCNAAKGIGTLFTSVSTPNVACRYAVPRTVIAAKEAGRDNLYLRDAKPIQVAANNVNIP